MTKTKQNTLKYSKIYFSNTISGTPDTKRDFGWQLVRYMKSLGCEVLDESVSGRSLEEHIKMFYKETGFDRRKHKNYWFYIRKHDISLVDKATHVVAIVNGPSFGVGMELQRALDKPKLGLNQTPILCLVEEKLYDGLSNMIRGVSAKESPTFELKTYQNLRQAKELIYDFLMRYT